MVNATRDDNHLPTLLGVSSVDGVTPVPLTVNPVTGRVLVNVVGGTSPLTTKGDVYTNNGTIDVRLGVGVNGQVLTADSTQAEGIAWTNAGAGDMTTAVYDAAAIAEQLVGLTAVQSLTNKTLDDATTTIADNLDATKKIAFQASGITTATTRTLTVQDSDGTIALTGNKLSDFAATTSAELAGTISDETGSGVLVFANSPTLVTPALGTPASGVATNLTGLPLTTGVTGILPSANGGTANGFTKFTGPTTAEKTFTLPDASATLLYSGGALGTPSSGTLTNATGLPISTGVSGLGTNVSTFLATPSSANLAAAVTDETGTGALVLATSPTLVTPILGTPTSGTLTNCTGLPLTGLVDDTTTALGVGSIELGHATDTTIARVSAGVISVEGVTIPSISSTDTLTNKTLTDPKITTSINTQVGLTYTLALTDASKSILANNAAAQAYTIPTNASVAFPTGTTLILTQYGAGVVTISGDTGVTVNGVSAGSAATSGQYDTLALEKIGTDEWLILGGSIGKTVNAQTGTTYTIGLSDDIGTTQVVTLSNAAAITLTIPTNATTAFPIGSQVDITQQGAGAVTISGAGVTINSKDSNLTTNGQFVGASMIKIGTDEWNVYGDLV